MSKAFTTTLQSLIAVLILSVFGAGISHAQEFPEPEDPADLELLPHHLNMDDDFNWAEGFFFHPFSGAVLTRIENPDPSGLNETDYVLQYERAAGGDDWAGFFYYLEEPVEVTDETVFQMKVWSPKANINFVMKFEMQEFDVQTGDLIVELDTAEEWVLLEWDMSEFGVDQETPWDLVTIIGDFPDGQAEGDIWYLDDFRIVTDGEPTSGEVVDVPAELQLDQNFPNPFNPTTNITFALPQSSHVTLEVFNLLGQHVETLVNGNRSEGNHTIHFDASNLTSGTYIYRLQAGDMVQTRNMTLIK